MSIETWPATDTSPVLVRRYRGRSDDAVIEEFQRDAAQLFGQGWAPVGQTYVPGQWGLCMVIPAILLVLVLVGILLCLRLLLTRPAGSLIVTYVARTGT